MSTLLLYQSKHGTTRRVADMIIQAWPDGPIKTVDLAAEKVPPLGAYHTVLIGGSIHMGKIQKKVGQFCEALIEELLTKRVGLFMCFMDYDKGMEEFQENFPFALREHAIALGLFGGEFLFDKMGFLEKRKAQKVAGDMDKHSPLNEAAIREFVEDMRLTEIVVDE